MLRLETPRLQLRSFAPDDAAELFALDHDPRVMQWIGPNALDSTQAYRERIETVYALYAARPDGLGLWAVWEKSAKRFLGWICLRPAGDYRFAAEAGFQPEDAELGYRLAFAAWGRGFATEASRALIADIFDRQQCSTVVATALAGNRASIRVMEKSGLTFDGQFQLPGFEIPSVRYALKRDEFMASRNT